MKINKLKPGMIVYDVHSYMMGNTTARSVGIWHVLIKSIDLDRGIVVASWNANPAREYGEYTWSKWRLKKPTLIKYGWGYRLQTRAEIAAEKAKC